MIEEYSKSFFFETILFNEYLSRFFLKALRISSRISLLIYQRYRSEIIQVFFSNFSEEIVQEFYITEYFHRFLHAKLAIFPTKLFVVYNVWKSRSVVFNSRKSAKLAQCGHNKHISTNNEVMIISHPVSLVAFGVVRQSKSHFLGTEVTRFFCRSTVVFNSWIFPNLWLSRNCGVRDQENVN